MKRTRTKTPLQGPIEWAIKTGRLWRIVLFIPFLFGMISAFSQGSGGAGIMWHEENPRIDRRHGIGIGVDPYLVNAPAQVGISYHFFLRPEWELEAQLRVIGLGFGVNYHFLGSRSSAWSPYVGFNGGIGGILDKSLVAYIPVGFEHVGMNGIFIRLAVGPLMYTLDEFLKETNGPNFSFGGSFQVGYRFVSRSSKARQTQ